MDDSERDELLITIKTELKEARKDISLLSKRLYGNGNKGLLSLVDTNTATIKTIKWGVGLGFTALGILIAIFNII